MPTSTARSVWSSSHSIKCSVLVGSEALRLVGMSPQSSDFVDPRERLVDEYQRAVEDLRRDLGDPQTLGEKWRFWRARRRLWKEKVVLPARSAKW
jgi:hypothetical protein